MIRMIRATLFVLICSSLSMAQGEPVGESPIVDYIIDGSYSVQIGYALWADSGTVVCGVLAFENEHFGHIRSATLLLKGGPRSLGSPRITCQLKGKEDEEDIPLESQGISLWSTFTYGLIDLVTAGSVSSAIRAMEAIDDMMTNFSGPGLRELSYSDSVLVVDVPIENLAPTYQTLIPSKNVSAINLFVPITPRRLEGASLLIECSPVEFGAPTGSNSYLLELDADLNFVKIQGHRRRLLGGGVFSPSILRGIPKLVTTFRLPQNYSNQSIRGVAAGPENTLWVLEGFGIYRYNHDGDLLSSFGREGRGRGDFIRPVDIATGPNNQIYVLDPDLHRIQIFNEFGSYVEEWQTEYLTNATSLDIGSNGNVFVVDPKAKVIYVFSPNGRLIDSWKTSWCDPEDIAIGPEGTVGVTGRECICTFSLDGKQIGEWSTRMGASDIGIARSERLAIGECGLLHVIVNNSHVIVNNSIYIYTNTGQLLYYGSPINDAIQPHRGRDLAFTDGGRMYLAGGSTIGYFDRTLPSKRP